MRRLRDRFVSANCHPPLCYSNVREMLTTSVEIDITPRQPEIFAGSHAACHCECEEGLIVVTSDCFS